MIEALQFSFVQNALLSGVSVSIACGIVGSLVVANRMVFIAGGMAHGAYGGLGMALFFGISPLFGTLVFSLALALALAYLTYENKSRMDALIGAIWAFGMAVGIIFIDFTSGFSTDLMGFLFGSILSVSKEDLVFMFAVCVFIFTTVLIFYKEFLSISFDIEFARTQGINAKLFYALLLAITALCIVASIRAVGLILVVALLSIPPFIAERFCSKLSTLMIFSVLLSVFFTITGLIFSYIFNITSGASIIAVASFALIFVYFLNKKTNFG